MKKIIALGLALLGIAIQSHAQVTSLRETGGFLQYKAPGNIWKYATPFRSIGPGLLVNAQGQLTVSASGVYSYTGLSDRPILGTAASRNVPASGNAASSEIALGSDTRFSDPRTPLAHTHSATDISTGIFSPTRLGTGTPAAGKYLDGQGAWLNLPSSAGGDMLKTVYDANNNGIPDNTELLAGQLPAFYLNRANGTGTIPVGGVAGLQALLDAKQATLPSFLGQSGNILSNNGSTLQWIVPTSGGGGGFTQAQIRAMFSSGQGLGYDPVNGQFSVNNGATNTQIGNYLRSLDGYAPGKVLAADNSNGFAWVTATTSGTTTGGSSGTVAGGGGGASTPYDSILVYADSTRSRFDPSTATVVNLTTTQQIVDFMASNQTNKDAIIANGLYKVPTGVFEQTGAWSNVRTRAQTRGGVTFQTFDGAGYSAVMVVNGSATRTKVCFDGIKFQGRYTGGGSPIVFTTELVPFDGIEFGYCEFTSNGLGDYNAFNITQYSTSSNSGAVARNFYFHHNYVHDMGRAGLEILSQGYDQVRLSGLVFTYNRLQTLGLNDTQHGFGISLSGLTKFVYEGNNVVIDAKNIGLEYVNAQYCIARNNKISGTNAALAGSGQGVSDDGIGTTRYLYFENTTTDVLSRPLYIYDSKYVTVTGGNWKGHRGIDMNVQNSAFNNMSVLIQSSVNSESGWQFGGISKNNTMSGGTVSSAGSTAAGYFPSFESIVLRSGTSNNTLTNVTTIMGLKSDGTANASSPETGADGRIVNQGTNNTITNNTRSTAP